MNNNYIPRLFDQIIEFSLKSKAYVFSAFNVEKEGNIIYLPIYMSYLLKEPKIDQLIVDLDISGL